MPSVENEGALMERLLELRNHPNSTPLLERMDRDGEMWQGYRMGIDATLAFLQAAINEIAKLDTPNPHSSGCVNGPEILKILGQPIAGRRR